jgi:FRG domain-containing protein
MSINSSHATAWMTFLSSIEEARRELRCSHSAAWFRGQSDLRWNLEPSLFRYGIEDDPDDRIELATHERTIQGYRDRWQSLLQEKKELKKKIRYEADGDSSSHHRYHKVIAEAKIAKSELARAQTELKQFRAPVNGERELFEEFVFRAGKPDSILSWVILAEMRHHGVPTRLLDWTDRLDIAIYFALEQYRAEMSKISSAKEAIDRVANLPKPCIWVLNPFLLARRATGRTAIWNLARAAEYDYYVRILRDRNWPFDEPIPTYPPTSIERVRSQRGYFTVFGNSKEPLDRQATDGITCLRRIVIDPEVAIFSLDYLARVQGLSPFEVYRDLDSLGRELSERFIRIQTRTGIRAPKAG